MMCYLPCCRHIMWYVGGLFFPILPTNLTFLFLPPLLICTPFVTLPLNVSLDVGCDVHDTT